MEVLTVYKIDYTELNTRYSGTRMSLKNMARLERFELPTLWFEDRGDAFLKFGEFCGFYLLLVEAVAAGLLVFVELFGSWRWSQLRNRLQRRVNSFRERRSRLAATPSGRVI